MPTNRNALIRYKTIDACLQNRQRKWTLEDLIEKVSDALYEYEGIDKGISLRTIQADIQVMRSDKLGYEAPIVVVDKKYYTYADSNFSITKSPITQTDLIQMNEALSLLKQFKGFSHFDQLSEVVNKLEEHVYSAQEKRSSIIDFEKNGNLKGLSYLDYLYHAILAKKALIITYKSFKARQEGVFVFHGWWLKEFKNRWFLVGKRKEEESILHLALDRIQEVHVSEDIPYLPNDVIVQEEFYKNTIGVTVNNLRPQQIVLKFTPLHAPYVITKPLHHSQKVIEENERGLTIELALQINFELEKEILGFGDGVEVLAPLKLRKVIQGRLSRALKYYQS